MGVSIALKIMRKEDAIPTESFVARLRCGGGGEWLGTYDCLFKKKILRDRRKLRAGLVRRGLCSRYLVCGQCNGENGIGAKKSWKPNRLGKVAMIFIKYLPRTARKGGEDEKDSFRGKKRPVCYALVGPAKEAQGERFRGKKRLEGEGCGLQNRCSGRVLENILQPRYSGRL